MEPGQGQKRSSLKVFDAYFIFCLPLPMSIFHTPFLWCNSWTCLTIHIAEGMLLSIPWQEMWLWLKSFLNQFGFEQAIAWCNSPSPFKGDRRSSTEKFVTLDCWIWVLANYPNMKKIIVFFGRELSSRKTAYTGLSLVSPLMACRQGNEQGTRFFYQNICLVYSAATGPRYDTKFDIHFGWMIIIKRQLLTQPISAKKMTKCSCDAGMQASMKFRLILPTSSSMFLNVDPSSCWSPSSHSSVDVSHDRMDSTERQFWVV